MDAQMLSVNLRPGSSRENPIEIDIMHKSAPSHQRQTYTAESSFQCQICFDKSVNLVLGCGHTWCYDCYNKYFHASILAASQNNLVLARVKLANCWLLPSCPYCKQGFGCYRDPEDADVKGSYFSLTCPEGEHLNCFVQNYFIRGIQMRFP